MVAYALDHGIYVGSAVYIAGADCCPDLDVLQKKCRYLFVTGISEINARDGLVEAPREERQGCLRSSHDETE